MKAWFVYFLILISTFSLARGGFSLRPLSIIDASAMTSLEEAPLVLNTAFTVLKSRQFEVPKKVAFFSDNKLKQYLAAPNTRDLLDAFQPAAPSQPKVGVKSKVAKGT